MTKQMLPFELKKAFPYFSHPKACIYLDSAATTHKPYEVIEAMTRFYTSEYASVNRSVYSSALLIGEKIQAARGKVASFLDTTSDTIIFTKGTTESLNLIASCFADRILEENDEILLPISEHHANLIPWQQVAAKKKAKLIPLKLDENGAIDWEYFLSKLSSKTKLITCAHISNVTGVIHPIRQIADLIHSVGGYLVVDGAQSVSHQRISMQELNADFFAFSGHKIYGPTGVGVLYGKKSLLESMPPYQFGGDMIEEVSWERTTFRAPPHRFEAGTPMIAEIIGLHAALDWVTSLGLENIAAWEKELLDRTLPKLQSLKGFKPLGLAKDRGALISFNVEGIHPLDLGMMLDTYGVAVRTGHLCAQPTMKYYGVGGAVRLSFGVYNTLFDVERFFEALEKAIKVLA